MCAQIASAGENAAPRGAKAVGKGRNKGTAHRLKITDTVQNVKPATATEPVPPTFAEEAFNVRNGMVSNHQM
jgi:hypothetical protein